jgi:hypothetical protein
MTASPLSARSVRGSDLGGSESREAALPNSARTICRLTNEVNSRHYPLALPSEWFSHYPIDMLAYYILTESTTMIGKPGIKVRDG